MILDILFLFSIAVHTIRTALWLFLYENIFPKKDISDCRQSPAFAGFCYCWNRFSDIINIRRAVFFMMTKNADKKREQMMM
ncbi:hypothetical protein, partial [Blautia sp.]|uniref:hypothetical protein n=1 Tax=Blautia sp. TaxID=1955243 RepID=UPI0025C55CFF